jgi:O-antigen/teichoic acid export membrane protein
VLGNASLANLVAASAAAILFAGLTTAVQGGLAGLERFGEMAASQWIQAGATSAGLIAGASLGDVEGALIGFSGGSAASAVCALYLLRRAARQTGITVRLDVRHSEWSLLWRLALPTFAAFLIVSVANLGGQILLAHQPHGLAEVGLFNVAYRWHLGLLFVPAAIAPVLLPMMTNLTSSLRIAESRHLFRLNVLLVLGITVIPAGILALLAEPALALSGPFYSAHTGPLILLAAAAIPSALNNVLSSASLSLRLIRAWLISDVVLAAALFATALATISSLGASGLALAYLVGFVATDAALILPLRRRLATAGVDLAPDPRPRLDPDQVFSPE